MSYRSDFGCDLLTGKLTAFAGLRTLRDLDLQLVRGEQIFGCDSEARGSYLLNPAVGEIAARSRAESAPVFATLAAVASGAHPIHRDCQSLVRIARERAERHP